MIKEVDSNMSTVTCLKWIQRGVAKTQPDTVTLTESEIAELLKGVEKTRLSDTELTDSDDERKRKMAKKPNSSKKQPTSNHGMSSFFAAYIRC